MKLVDRYSQNSNGSIVLSQASGVISMAVGAKDIGRSVTHTPSHSSILCRYSTMFFKWRSGSRSVMVCRPFRNIRRWGLRDGVLRALKMSFRFAL
jgi:hypothetical protein